MNLIVQIYSIISHNSHFPYAILVPRKAHKTQFKSVILLSDEQALTER